MLLHNPLVFQSELVIGLTVERPYPNNPKHVSSGIGLFADHLVWLTWGQCRLCLIHAHALMP